MGNKSDLTELRKVEFDEAVELAKKLNISAVFETSAKSNQSIDDVFFRSIVNCIDSDTRAGGILSPNAKNLTRSRFFSD